MIDAAELARLRAHTPEKGWISADQVHALIDELEKALGYAKTGMSAATFDAAELAGLRETLEKEPGRLWATTCLSLIDALEKAQGENALGHAAFNYVEAERDSARALLRSSAELINWCAEYCDELVGTPDQREARELCARIAKELGDAP